MPKSTLPALNVRQQKSMYPVTVFQSASFILEVVQFFPFLFRMLPVFVQIGTSRVKKGNEPIAIGGTRATPHVVV